MTYSTQTTTSVATSDSSATILDTIPSDNWVFLAVFIFVMVWIVLTTVVFIALLKKYPFGNWTQQKPNPFEKETFGMPRGVFRGILTLSLLFIVMVLEVVSLTIEGLEDKIEQLLVAFQMMLAFYFGSKVMHHVTAADERKKTSAPPTEVPDDTAAVG